MAGAITKIYSESEYRSWIGFTASTAAIVITEGYRISRGADKSSQMLDIASHAIGSAFGAWYTDKYLLMPVVKKSYVGVNFTRQF